MSVESEALPAPSQTFDASGARISRTILRLAWPVVIERFSISILSAVDAVLVGRYVGADGLAAVGIGALLFWIPLSGALALDVGATAVIARDVGAREHRNVQVALHTAIVAAMAWGLASMVAVIIFAPQLMRVMGAEPEVVPLGVEYLRAGAIGFPLLMVLYAVAGAMRGAGNTWIPMLILIVVNLVNAIVTFTLISGYPFELGVLASGIGYAAAAATGGLLALAVVAAGVGPVRMQISRIFEVSRASFRRLFHVALPVGLEEVQFMLAFLVYTRIIAHLGTQQLAAHTVALRSLEVSILPGFALGTAATALVGQYLGGQRPDIAERVAKRVRFFALLVLVVMAVLQFVLAPYIVKIFVDDPDVIDTGTTLLRVFAFALPGLGLHSSVAGALRGAGDVRYVLATFTLSAWVIRVPLAALLVLGFGLGAPFAWLAAVTENWTRAILILRRFRQGRWKTLKV